jgi:hypothetical protein
LGLGYRAIRRSINLAFFFGNIVYFNLPSTWRFTEFWPTSIVLYEFTRISEERSQGGAVQNSSDL